MLLVYSSLLIWLDPVNTTIWHFALCVCLSVASKMVERIPLAPIRPTDETEERLAKLYGRLQDFQIRTEILEAVQARVKELEKAVTANAEYSTKEFGTIKNAMQIKQLGR